MILGIGTDIIDIERVGGKIVKKSGFKEAVFSQSEIHYCESRTNSTESFAVRFAAKEAFLKALGLGIHDVNELNEIEILNTDSGRPWVKLVGKSNGLIEKYGISHIHVSLSHSKTLASAFIVIETEEK